MIALLTGIGVAAAVVALAWSPPSPRPARAALTVVESRDRRATALAWIDRAVPGRARARRDAQLPDALDRIAAGLRAGLAVGPALLEGAASLPDPLGAELRAVTSALRHGAPVTAALEAWTARPGASADVRLVAAALALGADAGGEVARAVDRIAATLRERRELQGEVHALATQARASAGVLAIAPVAFTLIVASIEPGALAFLLTTPVGLACLALGLALEAIGAAWMARITRAAA